MASDPLLTRSKKQLADLARKNRIKRKSSSDDVNHLDRAMGKTRQPNVGGGDAGDVGDSDSPEGQAAAILKDHSRVAGASWSKKAA